MKSQIIFTNKNAEACVKYQGQTVLERKERGGGGSALTLKSQGSSEEDELN